MKCKSLACIWSPSPPLHRVTAAAVLHQPPTLYTGGSDGSITCWNFDSAPGKPELIPIALLCGHSAPIADLAICFPFETSEKHQNVVNCGALISMCMDGVYVCVACSTKHPVDMVEEYDFLVNRESEDSDSSRCAVLIYDSFTLSVVQTVFSGNLPTGGPLKFMEVVLDVEDVEKQLVMIVDCFGKLLYVPVRIDSDSKVQNDFATKGNSSIMELRDYTDEKESLVAFSMFGHVLAFVYSTQCTFRDAGNGNVVGKILFSDYNLCSEDKSYIKGGFFLHNHAGISNNSFVTEFLAWDSSGAAIVYRLSSSSSDTYQCDAVCSISPSSSNSLDIVQSFSFISLKNYLLRTESVCFSVEEHVSWRPSVSMWLLQKSQFECIVKEVNLFDIWGKLSSGIHGGESLISSSKDAAFEGSRLVSSSIVVSKNSLSVYAVVYGFFNGDIELLRFHSSFAAPDSSKQRLCGHKGAVLCLASQITIPEPSGSGANHVLISGSKDCVVRLWDIDSGNPLAALHHHVGPVRRIIVSSSECDFPWRDCFLTVGDDSCVALASLRTLTVERLFPGHLYYPSEISWDGRRGYVACLCRRIRYDKLDNSQDVLYIWDVKSGARERVLYGASAQSTFDHLVKATINEDTAAIRRRKQPIKSFSPFPGVSTLCFDLNNLISAASFVDDGDHYHESEFMLQFSLSLLHLWNVDAELDNLLITEMKLKPPKFFVISSGVMGNNGSMTLALPGSYPMLELWKLSSEYSALRSLTMISLAQQLIALSHSFSSASSALAAFYTRKFLEKIPDIKPPHLQLLVSFWQSEFEHVRLAARSLFHCSASWSIPRLLCSSNAYRHANFHAYPDEEALEDSIDEESEITSWLLDSYQKQEDWISCIGGTCQDAMASRIIVAAALAVWYPSLVKSGLSAAVIHPLVELVVAMNEKYSAAAAEILAEGMENTWKACLDSGIPRLIADVLFQVDVSSKKNSAASFNMKETLVGILLPSLAMADSSGFLHVIERQIWSTASDSPVHEASLVTLIRVLHGSPRNLSPHLDKVITFILQTMDPSNSTMRKGCLQFAMTALKEVVRVFPMVALNDASSRLAVGDAIGEVNTASIRVYDMHSMSKIKVLDASGPPGLPSLLGSSIDDSTITTAISALSFSPDGEGLVAFSENGLMIRWWSLGSVWWEKLSRNLVPVHCTKLIFVPPWEGFSPSSTRSSIMASPVAAAANGKKAAYSNEVVQNLDLSYRLQWLEQRKVRLLQHGRELSIFQL
ncbi:hypothetical protein M569_08611 [Genlisea aurea]|uniref:Uncharacterized protein n=1 Tax=Genlisea aurea TaxID=192259 RepID=S8CGR4_9LAMI|nr:hypothetical protein M569_08611 [Genlisea aurea]